MIRENANIRGCHISLAWDNFNDLDIHLTEPSGEVISFRNKVSRSGGTLDVDMNCSQRTDKPCENICWPRNEAPRGHYRIKINHYAKHCDKDPTNFIIFVKIHDKKLEFLGKISHGDQDAIFEFDI